MEYCTLHGIPHSRFIEWSPEDRSKAISHTQWKKKFCQYCGTDPAEWIDVDGTAMEPPPYKAMTTHCLGCATLEEARAVLPKDSTTQYQTFLVRATAEDMEQWQMKPSL